MNPIFSSFIIIIIILIIIYIMIYFPFRISSFNNKLFIKFVRYEKQTENVEDKWGDILNYINPIKLFFQAIQNNSKEYIGLDDFSYINVMEQIGKISKSIYSSDKTLSKILTSRVLFFASEELKGKLTGEVDGLKSETIDSLANSFEILVSSIKEKNATKLYKSLVMINFVSRENVGISDYGNKNPYYKNFYGELNKLIKQHFYEDNYGAIDNFITRWEKLSKQEKDIKIYLLLTFIDEYLPELISLTGSLDVDSQSSMNKNYEKAKYIVDHMEKFGKAYHKNDLLSQFREITKLNYLLPSY
jgi:hypothetical protein